MSTHTEPVNIVGGIETVLFETVKPVHMVPSTVKSLFQGEPSDPSDPEALSLPDLFDVAVKVYKVAALIGGAAVYYAAYRAGFPEVLAIPAATNAVNLGYEIFSFFKKN